MAGFTFKIDSTKISYNTSKTITIGSVPLSVSLLSLRYNKKMYHPGEMIARIQLSTKTGTTKVPSVKEIEEKFRGFGNYLRPVTLTITPNNGNGILVADNYFVDRIETEFTKNANVQTVYVDLYIYSPDYMLTVDKYCKTYVNKKLCDNILADEIESGIIKSINDYYISESCPIQKINVDYSNTRFLRFVTGKSEVDGVTTYEKREFIQPYLVQYNESFYDFLGRTANRCGEYVYYEDGQLYVGLKKSSTVKKIDKSKILSIKYQSTYNSSIETVNSYVDTTAKEAVRNTTSSFPFNDEVPMDDYLGMVFKKDGFMTFGEAITKEGWSVVVDLFNFILNMSTPTKMVSKFAAKYAEAILFAGGKQAEANRKGNKKWVVTKYGSDNNSDSKSYEQSSTNKKCINAAEQYDPTTEKATLYGSMLTTSHEKLNPTVQQNLNYKFYQFVRKGCETVSKKTIQLHVGVGEEPFLLGDEVSLDDVNYIVTEVSELLTIDESNANEGGQIVTIVPYYTLETSMNSSAYTLTMPCPPMECSFVKTSGPQRAYVAESGDPTKMGRVCIRYPWQSKDDASSPWIRVAVPFAPSNSENGGMLFTPNEGDEVLVDYENGNIERPFVIGSLYNGSVKSPSNKRAIVSERGHSITFNDDDSVEDFMAGILPAFGMLKKYAGMISLGSDIDFGKKNGFCGGISISDKWGLYKIDASATKRNISIQSPFGDVKINAFSGIELSAPNGNITIKGKNVNIEAGNEVSITSGKFIDEKRAEQSFWNLLAKDLVGTLADDLVVPFADLSILRHVWEALLKPVAGTMTIQSGRYMLLNAGGGKAQIPNKGYTLKGMRREEKNNDGAKEKLSATIQYVSTFVDSQIDGIWDLYDGIAKDGTEYATRYDSQLADHKKANVFNDIYTVNEYKLDDINLNAGVTIPKGPIHLAANGLLLKGKELQKAAKDLKDGAMVNEKHKFADAAYIKEQLKNSMPDILEAIINGTDKSFSHTKNEFDDMKAPIKRLIIYRFILNKNVLMQDLTKPQAIITDVNAAANDATWMQFVSNLVDYKGKTENDQTLIDIGKNFANSMKKNIPEVGWSLDNRVWDTCKQGELLIADKGQSETINIVNGALNRTANTDYTAGIKSQLTNI